MLATLTFTWCVEKNTGLIHKVQDIVNWKHTGQVNSTGNLATRSDCESDPPGVGVTQSGCTDDDETENDDEDIDEDDDEDDDEGMDDVRA